MHTFNDKVVVVTGAGSGIGRAIAVTFAGLGARLVLADWKEDRLSDVLKEIESLDGRVTAHRIDVSDPSQMELFASKVIDEHGRVDVLINSAGVMVSGEIKECSLEDFHWVMDINFWGIIHGIYFFLPHMIEHQSGHIVAISSANGLAPFPYSGAYNASKAAIIAICETLRMEVTRLGIGVTVVCPGLANTELLNDGRYRTKNQATEIFLHKHQKRASEHGMNPFKVAKKIPPAIIKNKALVKIAMDSIFVSSIYRFFPGIYRSISEKIVRKTT